MSLRASMRQAHCYSDLISACWFRRSDCGLAGPADRFDSDPVDPVVHCGCDRPGFVARFAHGPADPADRLGPGLFGPAARPGWGFVDLVDHRAFAATDLDRPDLDYCAGPDRCAGSRCSYWLPRSRHIADRLNGQSSFLTDVRSLRGVVVELLVFILLIVVVGMVVYVLWKKRGEGSGPSSDWPFYAKRPLSAPE